MVTKLNPAVITDDMMYEGGISAYDYVEALDTYRVNERMQEIKEDKLWGEIRRAARTNNALQSAMEKCIIIYKLSKEYNNGI